MKQIEAFVNEAYHSVNGNKQEIAELKAEMKNHLFEAVYELKKEGKSEEEAIEIAITRFGGEKEMRSIVKQLFQAQKIFAKWVLLLAVMVLFISLALFEVSKLYQEKNDTQNTNAATNIYTILQKDKNISETTREKIIAIVQSTDHIAKVRIFNVHDLKDEYGSISIRTSTGKEADPNYKIERDVWAPKWLINDSYMYITSDWYIKMDTVHMEGFMYTALVVGIAVYVVLFTIWAIVNAYQHRRLHIGWIIAFVLFNVIGYLVYYLSGKKETSTKISRKLPFNIRKGRKILFVFLPFSM